jgi:hypothetical protein
MREDQRKAAYDRGLRRKPCTSSEPELPPMSDYSDMAARCSTEPMDRLSGRKPSNIVIRSDWRNLACYRSV